MISASTMALARQANWSGAIRRLALLLGVAGEAAAVLWILSDPAAVDVGESAMLVPALVVHLPAAVAFALGLTGGRSTASDAAWPQLGLIFGLAGFPGWGMALVLVARLLSGWRASATGVGVLDELVDLDEAEPAADPLARQTQVQESVEVEPLVDLLQDASLDARRAAIDALASIGDARSGRTLVGLLQDPSAEVRFYASIGLAKIENQALRNILQARSAVADGAVSGDACRRLGDQYYAYGTNALVDDATRRYYLGQAQQAYQAACDVDPADAPYGVRLARTLNALGDANAAILVLDEVLGRDPACAEAYAVRMEASFAAGRFADLRELAERLLSLADVQAEDRERAAWWAGRAS